MHHLQVSPPVSEKAANSIFQGNFSEELQFPADLSCSPQLLWCLLPEKENAAVTCSCEVARYASVPKTSVGMLQEEQLGPNGLLFPNECSQLDQRVPGSICRPNARLHP